MKTSFTYNLLKHLRNKKEEGGFTLIELLAVIIILSIMAAILLPTFITPGLSPGEARSNAEANLRIWLDAQGYDEVTGSRCSVANLGEYYENIPCTFTIQEDDGDLETTSLLCNFRDEYVRTGECTLDD